jgi:hypothetical protein
MSYQEEVIRKARDNVGYVYCERGSFKPLEIGYLVYIEIPMSLHSIKD